MTIKEVAKKIDAHLKRLEALQPKDMEHKKLYSSACTVAGRYASVWYVSYQGQHNMTREVAEAYLKYLDDGGTGNHFGIRTEIEAKKKAEQKTIGYIVNHNHVVCEVVSETEKLWKVKSPYSQFETVTKCDSVVFFSVDRKEDADKLSKDILAVSSEYNEKIRTLEREKYDAIMKLRDATRK